MTQLVAKVSISYFTTSFLLCKLIVQSTCMKRDRYQVTNPHYFFELVKYEEIPTSMNHACIEVIHIAFTWCHSHQSNFCLVSDVTKRVHIWSQKNTLKCTEHHEYIFSLVADTGKMLSPIFIKVTIQ